jgi:hypothetical protein
MMGPDVVQVWSRTTPESQQNSLTPLHRVEPYTLKFPNPKPETRNYQPATLHLQPSTINPAPSTLNPQISTSNPAPSKAIPESSGFNAQMLLTMQADGNLV